MDTEFSRPARPLVIVTQALLGTALLIGIGAIALIPGLAADLAESFPEYADLRRPLLAIAVAVIVLALVALAMVILLVHRIHRGTILTRSSLLWVDVIVAALACAVVLDIIGFVVISNGQAGSPFIALVQAGACVALTTLACITLVLRSLLHHAIVMRSELDEVV